MRPEIRHRRLPGHPNPDTKYQPKQRTPETGQPALSVLGHPEQLPHDGGLNAPEPQPPKPTETISEAPLPPGPGMKDYTYEPNNKFGKPVLGAPKPYSKTYPGGREGKRHELPTSIICGMKVIPEYPPVVLQRMVAAGRFSEQSAQRFLREYQTMPDYPWKKELLEYEAEQQRAQQVGEDNIVALLPPHDQAPTHEPQAAGEQPDDAEIDLSFERRRVGGWVEMGFLSRAEARDLLRGKDWDDDSQWDA